MTIWKFDAVLTDTGWLEPGWIDVDESGCIVSVSADTPGAAADHTIEGWLIPGFQNAHSHAFQYAMAGLAEYIPPGCQSDDFWSWREAMYALALQIDPDQYEAIATCLYAEMLRFGITAVTEFHYLQNKKDGTSYDRPAEMSDRLLRAAETAGIRLMHVPVYYRTGGFGIPASNRQRRFLFRDVDHYFERIEVCRTLAERSSLLSVGMGVHSLRAADPEEVTRILSEPNCPLHIHIAEQQKEIENCVTHFGKRPVEWLADAVELGPQHNLVHATHLTDSETTSVATSGCTVILCPSTEGNLGDGFFPLSSYIRQKGRWCIGTDSHVTLNPLENLRWLDYGHRLQRQHRNILCQEDGDDSGALAFREAWISGRRAMGQSNRSYFEVGAFFDGVVLDPTHPVLCGVPAERRLSALIYGADPSAFQMTIVNGSIAIDRHRHVSHDSIYPGFRKVVTSLRAH